MNTWHLCWIIPLSFIGGFALNRKIHSLSDILPFCEDCPRMEQEDPIGEKYGTRKEGTNDDK